jgi:putative SOS response-associated peptidase YedK
MCGRYLQTTSREGLASWFGFEGGPALEPRYNVAPSQPVPVVRAAADGKQRELVFVRWGLVPSWARDESFGAKTINARAETLAEKPAFRTVFRRRRCLVPADGFYEWKKVGKHKQPHVIRPLDGNPLAFAGLWDRWENAEGEVLESATIVTTDANDLLRPLHERMPVILPREHYALWLDPQHQQTDDLVPLLVPYPDERLIVSPVSSWVSDARHEGERCLAPPGTLFA